MRSIDYRFKILYAICVLMVICTHSSGGGINILLADWFSYPTVIPLFMFISGYLYSDNSEDHIGAYILKKIKRLIIPFYIYNLVYGLVVQLLRIWGFEIGADFTFANIITVPLKDGHQFIYNMGGWFIVPLFMVEVLNVMLRRLLTASIPKIKEHIMLVLFLAGGFVGYYIVITGYNIGWWLTLDRMLCLMPFFGCGNYYKKFLEKYFNRIPSFTYFFLIFAVNLVIIYAAGSAPYVIYSWCNGFLNGPVIPLVNGLLCALFWVRVAGIMEPALGRSKWINLLADNSYSIMMNQFLGFMIIKTVYAFISRIYSGFADFDMTAYKTDIWYIYIPKGVYHTLVIYVVAGIAVPIMIQKIIDKARSYVH